MPYTDPTQASHRGGRKVVPAAGKKECVRCKRARWTLTFLILATMLTVLYLNLSAR